MEINQKLNEIICSRGIKRCFLANALNISEDRVSKILNCQRRLRADEFLAICAILELDPKIFY